MAERPISFSLERTHPMVNRVSVKQLRAFVAAARHGSFTRAGEQIGLSQPALTMTIRQFEETVGVTLFDRTTRRLTLTSDGEQFLPTAERLLSDFAFAIEDLHALAERQRGSVGIAAVYSIATAILPKAASSFAALYPAIRISLRDDNSGGVCRRVRRNEVDFGFASRDADDSELEFMPILRDRMGVVAKESHPLFRQKKPIAWASLDEYEYLGLSSDTGPWLAVSGAETIPERFRAPRLLMSHIPTMHALLESSLSFTALPALPFALNSNKGAARYRPLKDPVVMRELCLVKRKGRSLSRAAQEMRTHALKLISELKGSSDLVEILI